MENHKGKCATMSMKCGCWALCSKSRTADSASIERMMAGVLWKAQGEAEVHSVDVSHMASKHPSMQQRWRIKSRHRHLWSRPECPGANIFGMSPGTMSQNVNIPQLPPSAVRFLSRYVCAEGFDFRSAKKLNPPIFSSQWRPSVGMHFPLNCHQKIQAKVWVRQQ